MICLMSCMSCTSVNFLIQCISPSRLFEERLSRLWVVLFVLYIVVRVIQRLTGMRWITCQLIPNNNPRDLLRIKPLKLQLPRCCISIALLLVHCIHRGQGHHIAGPSFCIFYSHFFFHVIRGPPGRGRSLCWAQKIFLDACMV